MKKNSEKGTSTVQVYRTGSWLDDRAPRAANHRPLMAAAGAPQKSFDKLLTKIDDLAANKQLCNLFHAAKIGDIQADRAANMAAGLPVKQRSSRGGKKKSGH